MRILLALLLVVLVLTSNVAAKNTSGVFVVQKTDTGDNFEIQGTITSVNDSSFTVRGELVAASSENMERFKNNEIVKVGNFVLVEGEIKNNIMMAKDVTVLGQNPEANENLMEQAKVETTPAPVEDKNVLQDIVSAIKNILFK